MEHLSGAMESLRSFKENRLSNLRSPREFFNTHQVSKPADLNQTLSRITYNTRYFSGNYGIIVAILTVYAVITTPLVIVAIAWFVLGFAAINRFGPDPAQVGEHKVSQTALYTGLFVIGLPLLWWSSPLGLLFWIVGASSVLILTHACLMEPGLESEYGTVEAGTIG